MFKIPKEQAAQLDDLHSRARFIHRGEKTICVLRDNHIGKDWVRVEVIGEGDDAEQMALAEALKKAQPGDRPLTPAEMAAQLAKYKERFGDLAAQPPQNPTPAEESAAPKRGRPKKADAPTKPAEPSEPTDSAE